MLRPLLDKSYVEKFLEGICENSDDFLNTNIANQIVEAETLLASNGSGSTLSNPKDRVKFYEDDPKRWELRGQIVNELFTKKRLPKDDDIKLGEGGALPLTKLKRDSQAFVITGPPASGKSGISEKIADFYGAVILDSDYSKRKMPEYDAVVGASKCHAESGILILGGTFLNQYKFQTLLDLCGKEGINIVVPKIGDSPESLVDLAQQLKIFGYDVHLTLLDLDRKQATLRAAKRFHNSKRYVPLSVIYDVYGNEPIISYFKVKAFHHDEFKTLGLLSNDVMIGKTPKVIESEKGNPAELFL